MTDSGDAPRDLLVYFIGHGGFADNDDYYLALRSTRGTNIMASSMRIKSLAHTLKEEARVLRRIIILDCCFSAGAFNAFQAEGPAEVAIRQTIAEFQIPDKGDGFPERGTSLLCASSSKKPARSISRDEKH